VSGAPDHDLPDSNLGLLPDGIEPDLDFDFDKDRWPPDEEDAPRPPLELEFGLAATKPLDAVCIWFGPGLDSTPFCRTVAEQCWSPGDPKFSAKRVLRRAHSFGTLKRIVRERRVDSAVAYRIVVLTDGDGNLHNNRGVSLGVSLGDVLRHLTQLLDDQLGDLFYAQTYPEVYRKLRAKERKQWCAEMRLRCGGAQ
jgi:hypothetical protein